MAFSYIGDNGKENGNYYNIGLDRDYMGLYKGLGVICGIRKLFKKSSQQDPRAGPYSSFSIPHPAWNRIPIPLSPSIPGFENSPHK